MELDNLNKTLEDLKVYVKKDLIKELDKKGHKGHGLLEKSIKVEISYTEDYPKIELSCFQYLIYLDDGKFYEVWITRILNEINKKIADAILEDIMSNLSI